MNRLRAIFLALLMVAGCGTALAWPRLPHLPHKQTGVVKPLRLRHIAGVVVDRRGLFIAYPAVELRDAGDHHVIATSFADGNGRFHFEDRKPGQELELRFAMKGFEPVQYTIDTARFGHASMKAVMTAAH